jgi:hypothetical protein
VNLTPPSTS